MRTCSRKGMIVYTKYAMFIKQSPARFTIVPKNDTETRHRCVVKTYPSIDPIVAPPRSN